MLKILLLVLGFVYILLNIILFVLRGIFGEE